MRKIVIVVAAVLALAAGAYLYFAKSGATAPEGYKNANIAFGMHFDS